MTGEDPWARQPPADSDDLAELSQASAFPLPTSYVELLRSSTGGSGDLARQPGWFVLWSAREVMPQNQAYKVQQQVPGFIAIGTNGGGGLLAFDARRGQTYPVVSIPFIPMQEQEALQIADSFEEFRTLLGQEWADE
jgi:hypothetical protein